MALPGGLSPIFLGGLLAMGIGIILHIVGMATPEWSVATILGLDREIGVFKSCAGPICGDNDSVRSDWEACQAFAIIGILLAFGSLIVALLHMVLPILGKGSNKLFPLISAALGFATLGSILLTVIIWGASVHDDLGDEFDIGYSFALTLVGGILVAIGGALVFLGSRGAVDA